MSSEEGKNRKNISQICVFTNESMFMSWRNGNIMDSTITPNNAIEFFSVVKLDFFY